MRNYNNAHRLFLQTFVSRKLLDEVETKRLYVKAAKKYNVDAPADQLAEFIQTINKQIEPFFIKIRAGKSEDKGRKYYALVNSLEDDHAKLATGFQPYEMEYVKKVIEKIVNAEEGFVSSMDLVNIGHDLPKKVTSQMAQEIMDKLSEENWLTNRQGNISFGPRAIIELGQYLKTKFPEQILLCELCKDLVILGDACLSCGKKIHKYCAATVFREMPQHRRKCPSCKEPWELDIIKLPKTSSAFTNGNAQHLREVEVIPSSASAKSSSGRKRPAR